MRPKHRTPRRPTSYSRCSSSPFGKARTIRRNRARPRWRPRHVRAPLDLLAAPLASPRPPFSRSVLPMYARRSGLLHHALALFNFVGTSQPCHDLGSHGDVRPLSCGSSALPRPRGKRAELKGGSALAQARGRICSFGRRLDAHINHRPSILRPPTRQQPVQQQQSKAAAK